MLSTNLSGAFRGGFLCAQYLCEGRTSWKETSRLTSLLFKYSVWLLCLITCFVGFVDFVV